MESGGEGACEIFRRVYEKWEVVVKVGVEHKWWPELVVNLCFK
jgi:hypothetical protein